MSRVRLGPSRRLSAWITILIGFLVIGGVMALKAPTVTEPNSTDGLPHSSQAYQVAQLQKQLPASSSQPALVVYSRADGSALSASELATINASIPVLTHAVANADPQSRSEALGPLRTGDGGKVAVLAINVSTLPDDNAVKSRVTALRDEGKTTAPAGVQVHVTGGPAFTTDIANVFNGADTTLLLATALVVALLLLITYRSPILWIIPLLVVGMADQVSAHLSAVLAPHLGIRLDGASTGISQVLVFGAGTDYALLLIARYRERLRKHDDRFAAMRFATNRTAEAILASGVTVTLALGTLLLASLSTTRAIGFAGAIGVITAVAFGLILLPAALVVCGRGIFWPLVPKVGDESHEDGKVFGRIGAGVAKRPGTVAIASVIFLVLVSLLGLNTKIGLSTTQQFTSTPESVVGQQILTSAFPAGSTEPAIVIAKADHAAEVQSALESAPGVVKVTPGPHSSALVEFDVTLSAPPSSAASFATIDSLRTSLGAIQGANALIGGDVAAQLDYGRANRSDALLIAPIILVIVLLVLLVLLRSLVAPFVLLATVIATYLSSLGISWVIFVHVMHYPAIAAGVRLNAFLFLVALGVDYNIFLTARAREETPMLGTRGGMLSALRSTGGVITSAGILLAAVFAVLGVLPLIQLTQVGTIVCVGVLLDTLLVRTVLVPALTLLLGDRFWWPKVPAPAAVAKESATVS